MSQFQLYVIRKEFRSGEMNITLAVGDVIEVDTIRRVCRYRGQEKPVRAILSAIGLQWITPPRPDEMEAIRRTGTSQDRKYDTPDLAKIQADRATAMRDTIPEDMREEVSSGLSEEVVQSMRMGDVQAPNQYNVEGHETVQRVAGQQDMPQDPVTSVVAADSPPRSSAPEAPTVPAPGTTAATDPVMDRVREMAARQDKINGPASPPIDEMAKTADVDGVAEEPMADDDPDLAAYDHIPTEEELAELKDTVDAADKEPTYDGDFDYKKRMSKAREEEVRKMPLAELAQLSTFLIHRDKVEEKSRKITQIIRDIFHEREAKESRLPAKETPAGKAVRTASEAPASVPTKAPVPQNSFTPPSPDMLSFNFDTTLPDNAILHAASMSLSAAQANELAAAYNEVGHPLAKRLADIARQRISNAGPQNIDKVPGESVEDPRAKATPSIDPTEGDIVNAVLGGSREIVPNHNPNQNPNVGAIVGASDDDILNSGSPAPPSLPSMNQSSKPIDVSPVNLRPGETEVMDVGNQPAPGEAQSFIGSEEGVTQVKDISGATSRALNGQPEGRDPNVADISGSIGQTNH